MLLAGLPTTKVRLARAPNHMCRGTIAVTPTPELPVPVAIALSEVQRASRNARRFWNLLYALGAATAMALIVGILLSTLGHSVQAIVTGVATLLGGAGSAFLVKMKNDAVEELERAKSALLRSPRRPRRTFPAVVRRKGAISKDQGSYRKEALLR